MLRPKPAPYATAQKGRGRGAATFPTANPVASPERDPSAAAAKPRGSRPRRGVPGRTALIVGRRVCVAWYRLVRRRAVWFAIGLALLAVGPQQLWDLAFWIGLVGYVAGWRLARRDRARIRRRLGVTSDTGTNRNTDPDADLDGNGNGTGNGNGDRTRNGNGHRHGNGNADGNADGNGNRNGHRFGFGYHGAHER